MKKKKNPLVFLDVSIDGNPAERIVIEVYMKLTKLPGVVFLFLPYETMS